MKKMINADEFFKSLGFTKKTVYYVIVFTNFMQSAIQYATKEDAERAVREVYNNKHIWGIERRERWD